MNLFQLFKASLHNPKKIAAFRLVPIGKVMQYIFTYVLIITMISFVQFINGLSVQETNMEELLEYLKDIKWLIYPFSFVLLFVLNTLFIFIRISIFAYIGVIILSILKRKGEYRHMWRTALFASTLPMLVSIVFSIFYWSSGYFELSIYMITLVYLFLASKYYPIKR
ncbi:DUF1189 domain-containing protein [Psychrobacillus glaciei]|uniref:DUF1189 domain-containing protein n=1 Tax=Psychrobacillus glaciei TaxID=2283160 RepID=A0A5J6SN52_9BACI|nr:DUF1189 family protein [Psychrobacillus glaciei]QFF99450.1 DUF1189 domain-containing protein [Psychrobacillus glaciei]